MEFFARQTHIDFISLRRPAYALSLALVVLSLFSITLRGMNLGLDFTGGTLVELAFPAPVETSEVTKRLERAGFGNVTLLHIGSNRELLIRVPAGIETEESKIGSRVLETLTLAGATPPEVRRVEFVGAQVGDELVEKGGLAMLYALAGIGIYIGLRFERRFAAGAIIATMHDTVLTLGWFSLTGVQFDLTVLAAVLAVIGYSVNDTIVVFDRIRNNLRKLRRADPVTVVNQSINETMSRTLITSGTTLLVVLSMLLFGGPQLYGFSLALLIGILVGTYSSIYVASAVTLDLGMNRGDVLPLEKETGKPMDPAP